MLLSAQKMLCMLDWSVLLSVVVIHQYSCMCLSFVLAMWIITIALVFDALIQCISSRLIKG